MIRGYLKARENYEDAVRFFIVCFLLELKKEFCSVKFNVVWVDFFFHRQNVNRLYLVMELALNIKL